MATEKEKRKRHKKEEGSELPYENRTGKIATTPAQAQLHPDPPPTSPTTTSELAAVDDDAALDKLVVLPPPDDVV